MRSDFAGSVSSIRTNQPPLVLSESGSHSTALALEPLYFLLAATGRGNNEDRGGAVCRVDGGVCRAIRGQFFYGGIPARRVNMSVLPGRN